MLNININTPASIMQTLKEKFKDRRLTLDFTQEGLSNKSGVSLGSLKRFENSGQISLESLLKLALVLECLDDFSNIAQKQEIQAHSIDELLKTSKMEKIKKRGSIK
jgi:transcriptional regulator with XRE-family HTH domain